MRRPSDCHPPKPNMGKGLCGACRERKWRQEHPVEAKAREARRRQRNPGRCREYYRKHRDRILAKKKLQHEQNPEIKRLRSKEWRERNPRKHNEQSRRHRARMANAFVGLFQPDMLSDCFYCGNPADTVDHFAALSIGGLHTPANLVAACRLCNGRMYNSPPGNRLTQLSLIQEEL